MELSPEDQLRLNVLLAQDVHAVRIDESAAAVFALTTEGEACVTLNPTCRLEQYLRRVRELLSYRALGSPGGYPVFLQRWTRMGQHRDGQLDKLLLLGEPEAVVAVAGAPGLTPELARRAWWSLPNSDIARRVLESQSVAESEFGRVASDYLLEHLAFETEPIVVVQTIRLVLQPGLISNDARQRLWDRATHRTRYHRLGFIEAEPESLPIAVVPRSLSDAARQSIDTLCASNNSAAVILNRAMSASGQAFVTVARDLLQHPVDKDTVACLLNAIGRFFRHGGPDASVQSLVDLVPDLRAEIGAFNRLALVSEELATPVLSRTTASGTLLARKLAPVTDPLTADLSILSGHTPKK